MKQQSGIKGAFVPAIWKGHRKRSALGTPSPFLLQNLQLVQMQRAEKRPNYRHRLSLYKVSAGISLMQEDNKVAQQKQAPQCLLLKPGA